MKKILGLDLGTNSIGWALVNEAENESEKSSIIKIGSRIIHYDNFVNSQTGKESKEPVKDFCGGKSISCNAGRTSKRSMRRNLQRYKLRRYNLIEVLKEHNFITDDTILSESGNRSTFETYRLRAKAATEEITLSEFARVLLMINKKRGYKSSRKAKNEEEGQLIDGMSIAKELCENNLTPGEFTYQILCSGKNHVPDFYRSDLQSEFDKVWEFQKTFYPAILNDELKNNLRGKNKKQTWAICQEPFNLVGIKRDTKGFEQKKENYQWRSDALRNQLGLEELAIVLQEINGQLSNSSGYLGDISDRSKELYFKHQTVGQYLMRMIEEKPNDSLKNKVFYRQYYMDEFEQIWNTQRQFHPELTPELKHEIRDIIIFYQRPLKSQKGLISLCEFESRQIEVTTDGKKRTKTVGLRVCPKSSPLFQEFKIWQVLNNLIVSGPAETDSDTTGLTYIKGKRYLTQEEKEQLFKELSYKEKLTKADALKFLFVNYKDLDLNFASIEGNRTQAALFKAYQNIIEQSGHGEYDFSKMESSKVLEIVSEIFNGIGINTDILHFDSSLEGDAFEKQPSYRLWHLLYSFEGDNSKTGNEKLIQHLKEQFGFEESYASELANIVFQADYGSLSSKAMRRILPYMKDGLEYSAACEYAGYRHSKKSLTKEELANKVLKDHLELLPKNRLRNPVVEKILNQMVNVVNTVIDTYGKPDEIRIELARELKKSAKEREEMTRQINASNRTHEEYSKVLQSEFNIPNPSRNDIIRYKLYLELESNGFRTLYSNTYIPQEKLFSKEFDIEHIIPQAKLFDDSFSNKTIEARAVNIAKSNATALDYVKTLGETEEEAYKSRVENLFKLSKISKTKRDRLLMAEEDIPSGFINRDLRDSQYIAKKAREILEEIVMFVVPTTGAITDRLREDWGLVNVMQELNWDKYDKLGLTTYREDHDGRQIRQIKDWTKRNDHRHHAMDALTIAFTKRSIIQYLNNLNARVQKGVDDYIDLDIVELDSLSKSERSKVMASIEHKELERDEHGKLRFKSPFGSNSAFRAEAKKQLENTLISIKAKNKVTTKNTNVSKCKGGFHKRTQLTPRGQLHNETVYGTCKQYVTNEEKVGSAFNAEKIATVANPRYRKALLTRLNAYNGDAKKAFTGANALAKKPIYLDAGQSEQVPERVKTVTFETIFTIRKEISPDLKLDKVVDRRIRKILEQRLKDYGNDPKKAFTNLEQNPIWLNEEKGIAIKRVTITGISNGEPLHDKRDKDGNLILDKDGNKMPTDYVSTSNNHHVAIYRDAGGNLQEQIVSFYEAVARVNAGLPIIDKEYRKSEGWTFLFTMKQNEYFVFPNPETGFNPQEIDLLDPKNYELISPNLFRVQKFSYKNYVFRHHLETTVDTDYKMKGVTWTDFRSSAGLDKIVKVRINHIGQIVSVGEY